jgi:hypothetical protein
MRIRRRDGTMAEVDDSYILSDGESVAAGLMFMDSGAHNDADIAFAVLETAHAQYRDTISNAWRGDRWQGQMTGNARHLPDQNRVNDRNLSPSVGDIAASYRQYASDLENRWRR